MLPRWYQRLFVIVAFLGFADAMYLTANHYFGVPLLCGPLHGCDIVTNSVYSEILGVPVALLGVFYYVAVFAVSILALEYNSRLYAKIACVMTILGFGGSIYFVTLMAFVLHAWCLYCLGSATTSTILFILGMIGLRMLKKPMTQTENSSA